MTKLLYPELSFELNGIGFYVQNKLGRFAREKQYGDLFEERLKLKSISYAREYIVPRTANRIDFIVNDEILVELKAVPFLKPDDFAQVQRYLQVLDLELGLLINFSPKVLKPQRVLKLSTIGAHNISSRLVDSDKLVD